VRTAAFQLNLKVARTNGCQCLVRILDRQFLLVAKKAQGQVQVLCRNRPPGRQSVLQRFKLTAHMVRKFAITSCVP
jgi:hypothetical protein